VRGGAAPTGGWRLLALLFAAYVLSFVDRQVPSMLVEPLKRDLGIGDAQIGLLQGLGFAVVLGLTGLPLARLMDRGVRRVLLGGGVLVWSLATAASALAKDFTGLLLCRAGVALGEAVLTPAAHALIAERMGPRRVGLALGVYGAGAYVGLGLSYLAAGAVLAWAERVRDLAAPGLWTMSGWRLVFLAVGAPGLVLAPLLLAAARGASGPANPPAARVRLGRPHLRAVGVVNLALGFATMAAYAVSAWAPSLLVRTFGWSVPAAGAALGPIFVGCGLAAALAGGAAADWAASRWPDGRLRVLGLCAFAAIPFAAVGPRLAGAGACLGALAAMIFLSSAAISIGPSAQQAVTGPGARALVSASGVLTVNLLGLGLGPTLVGLATERVLKSPAELNLALATLLPAMLAASALAALAGLRIYRAGVADAPPP